MSVHLVKRWRQAAKAWREVGVSLSTRIDPNAVEIARCGERYVLLTQCADSLERSLKIAARAKREKGDGK